MSRKKIVTANWKMHKTIAEAQSFINALSKLFSKKNPEVLIAAPFTALGLLKSPFALGGQNMHDAPSGAFTGEISGEMLKSAGASFVLIGHSERRHLFHESNLFINKKVKRALEVDLRPVLCIGEKIEEREAGETKKVLEKQLFEGLEEVSSKEFENMILAYEPVWAIGTGKVAKAADAEEVHHFLRELISKRWDRGVADRIVIQYGGSVKPENASELISQKNIDGFLVGGASLDPQTFYEIISKVERV